MATLAFVLTLVGVALAVVPLGLQNSSFEADLDHWTARTSVYGPLSATSPLGCDQKWQICVLNGSDSFQVTDGLGTRAITVTPRDGNKMVRLGGPYHSSGERQQENYRYFLEQTFQVDPANPSLQLNYNVFTFDYTGFDELQLRVRLVDESGAVIVDREQGGFSSGTNLKTTGWRSFGVDLTGYENQQVFLRVELAGTQDNLYGFWGYIDAGTAPPPPPAPVVQPIPLPGGGGNVAVQVQTDPGSGTSYVVIPQGQAALFPGGCVPLTLDVPLAAGAATLTNVTMLFKGTAYAMTQVGTTAFWRVTIPCVSSSGDLTLRYDATENGQTQTFNVPFGGIALIDPQGVVYDQAAYDAKVALGITPDEARSQSAIPGATVRLQRDTGGGTFVNVLSADPGIQPKVNPEITGPDGRFQWDVSEGSYRVVVTASGFTTATSRAVAIPPPVLDLHVGLVRPTEPAPPPVDVTKAVTPPPATPDAAPVVVAGVTAKSPPAAACAALRGKALTKCKADRALKAEIARTCRKLKGSKAATCAKRVRALAACRALKSKKRAACVKKAKRIGAPKRKR